MGSMLTKDEINKPNVYHDNMIENRVAVYMAIKKLEKRDIIKMTGIDRHTLNNVYKDRTKGIEFETLNKLCFALDCTPNDLFRYIPDKK